MQFLNFDDKLKSPTYFQETFSDIAENLLNKHAIKTHDTLYRIKEIEFYWHSPEHHIDNSTYKRIHVHPKNGDWYFHYSGVDIALNNEITGGYGGILIRSILDVKNNRIYKGPMVCAMRLFSGTNAFTESIKTRIVPHNFNKEKIEATKRVGLGKNANENGAGDFLYRFLIDKISPSTSDL